MSHCFSSQGRLASRRHKNPASESQHGKHCYQELEALPYLVGSLRRCPFASVPPLPPDILIDNMLMRRSCSAMREVSTEPIQHGPQTQNHRYVYGLDRLSGVRRRDSQLPRPPAAMSAYTSPRVQADAYEQSRLSQPQPCSQKRLLTCAPREKTSRRSTSVASQIALSPPLAFSAPR